MQEGKPICYFSHALPQRARLKSTYERELLAIVLAVKHWKHYLMGHHFIIRTDHYSLKFLFTQREVNTEYHKLLVKLMGYSFEIQYKEGKKNQAADALSRSPLCEVDSISLMQLNLTMSNYSTEIDLIKHAITQDPHLSTLVELLSTPEGSKPGYELKNGILLYTNRLVIPAASPLVQKYLRLFHDSPTSGHRGFSKYLSAFVSQFILERY